jgi:zinc protease
MDVLRRNSLIAFVAILPTFLTSTAAAADRTPQIPDLKVEKYTLPNGLDVIMLEDHSTPVVGVNLWYKVGSKNEKTGRTGFAHLFEHLMFQGSEHHDKEYFGPIEKLGAQINGSTNTDRTNYFETLPSNALELALWLESDRMGFLLPALTQQKLDNQRDVVKNERRQRVDNVPYGQSMEKMLAAMYPPDHPYHHSVIGSMADLSAASRDDVSAFFRNYYTPNNASLAIVGDFKPAEAKQLVEKYFGPIPSGPAVPKLKPSIPKLEESKHLTMTDRVSLARVQLAWPTVERGHADEIPLDVLASVLGQLPKENRLYRTLVFDKQLAVQAAAMSRASELAGTFDVMITARPDGKLDELVKIADEQIEKLKKDGPTAEEVAKAQSEVESGLVFSLQSATRLADFLNGNNVQHGDPKSYVDEMKKLFAVTPEDVKRVANAYLAGNRVRLDVNPGPPTPRPAEAVVDRSGQRPAAAPSVVAIKDSFDRSKMPAVGPNPAFAPPPVVRRKLSNGLEVLIAERHQLPIVSLRLVARGGDNIVPTGKEGLAGLSASLLTEGTETRDALKLAGELSEIGASLNASGGQETTSLLLTTLTKHEAKALDLFVDVLLHPAFPEKDLERLRKQTLAALLRRRDSAGGIAAVVFPKILYGDGHPYGRQDSPASVKGLSRDDIVRLYKKIFLPNNAALIVAGDVTPEGIVAKLEEGLKDWKPGEAPEVKYPTPPAPPKNVVVYLVDKPAAAQSVISMGKVGLPRSTPDYFPLVVMNGALGGQFSSRINLNLREDKGYSYGARSSFDFLEGPGPFEAGGSVQTAVTKEALVELFKEITDINGVRPLTAAELAFAKDRLVKGFPSRFETTLGQTAALSELFIYHLPDDYFTTYQSKIEAVTKDEADRVAQKYLDPEEMTVLVVGDRKVVEPKLKELPYAQDLRVLDPEGNPVKDDGATSETPRPQPKTRTSRRIPQAQGTAPQ